MHPFSLTYPRHFPMTRGFCFICRLVDGILMNQLIVQWHDIRAIWITVKGDNHGYRFGQYYDIIILYCQYKALSTYILHRIPT